MSEQENKAAFVRGADFAAKYFNKPTIPLQLVEEAFAVFAEWLAEHKEE